ncbi:MAG: NDP-sugar synthase [Candidatus Bathyarchaeia archaeon]|nr:NDP-sugar synthase [Candidatus Bathyarchaeota archaeon]
MKAIILAGGYGTRLRPLTCVKPKLLFPILGKPILKRNLEVLSRIGVDKVILAVNYLAKELKKEIGKNYAGVNIVYSFERVPLGTGGPIKKAEKLIDEYPFFIMNGDILFEEEISGILKIHNEKHPIATIALHEVDDPSRFGVVKLNEEMFIEEFIEKPKSTISKLINAGIYLAEKEIFNYIRLGKVSLEKDVFPILASEKKLLGYKYNGLWIDIGKLNDFVKANFMLLDNLEGNLFIESNVKIGRNAKINPPAFIGAKSKINGEIGPYAVINNECIVHNEAKISNSILFQKVHIGRASVITGSIIGDEAFIDRNVEIKDSILSSKVIVNKGIRIINNVKICPFKEVEEDIIGPNIIR